jgi:hypothetical protein
VTNQVVQNPSTRGAGGGRRPPGPSAPSGTPGGGDGQPSSGNNDLAADIESLREFLIRLRVALDETINGDEPLTSPAMTQHFQDAWPEIVQRFKQVDTVLGGTQPPVEGLEGAGLLGRQLKVKIEGARRAFSRVWRSGIDGLRRHTGSFLRWGDIILGSLTSVIPAAEAIKEFKEAVEADVNDQADAAAATTPAPPPQA